MLHDFCDLSKEFESDWHKGLLFKLHTYGITGNLFKLWFNSYIVNKKQKVSESKHLFPLVYSYSKRNKKI